MRKRLVLLLLVVFLASIGSILMSGCGGGNGDETTGPTPPIGNIWDPFVGLWKGFNGEDNPPCGEFYRLFFDIRLTVNADGTIDYSVRISEEWGTLLEEYSGSVQPNWTAGSAVATWGDEMARFEGPANGRYEYLNYPWDVGDETFLCMYSERPDIKVNLHR